MPGREDSEFESSEAVLAKLEALRAKRGYLMPHHGLLLVGEPELLAAYDQLYTTLTLGNRTLDDHTKEMVWLVNLTATTEAIATHHIRRMHDAGGSDQEIELAVRLAAYAKGADYFAFVHEHWSSHLPDYNAVRAYREGLTALVAGSGVSRGCIEISLAAVT